MNKILYKRSLKTAFKSGAYKLVYKTDQNNPQIKEYKEAVEKGKQSFHVLPFRDQWIVKRADSSAVSETFGTQSEAADYAKSVSQNQGTAVFIHGADGKIVDRRDYSSRA